MSSVARAGVMQTPHVLARTKLILGSSRNSFSFLRRNFFAFGLEIILLALGLTSGLVNLGGANPASRTSSNRYLGMLLSHPDLNKMLIAQIKTQRIQISPEKERFISAAQAATADPLLVQGSGYVDETAKTHGNSLLMSADGVLQKPNYTSRDAYQKKDIEEYVVKNGDSIGKIASNYGISARTILYENKIGETDTIRPGQVLQILPTTGIKHTVLKNETIDSIAKKYNVDAEAILAFNEIEVPEDIESGEVLIIPNAKADLPTAVKPKVESYKVLNIKTASVPDSYLGSGGALVWPVSIHTITQYYSSKHRALDISNGERPQFWSAQDGIVELSGWQNGYGNTIVINHGNGLKTRYAHASELYVSAGDKVVTGQLIGRVGNTGRAYGRTGNHIHFEVVKNGTKYDPLKFFK